MNNKRTRRRRRGCAARNTQVKSSNFGELNHESCREKQNFQLSPPLSKNHHSAAALIRLANSSARINFFGKKNLLISTAAPPIVRERPGRLFTRDWNCHVNPPVGLICDCTNTFFRCDVEEKSARAKLALSGLIREGMRA
jgi:hypothetical protein